MSAVDTYIELMKWGSDYMVKFCSNCGKEIKEGADVCLNCGKKVISSSTKNKPKDFDKNLVIAIAVGAVGFVLILFFWIFIAIVDEFDETEYPINQSTRKSCCMKAGGKWDDNRCVYGYWFDDDYYDDCIENSF